MKTYNSLSAVRSRIIDLGYTIENSTSIISRVPLDIKIEISDPETREIYPQNIPYISTFKVIQDGEELYIYTWLWQFYEYVQASIVKSLLQINPNTEDEDYLYDYYPNLLETATIFIYKMSMSEMEPLVILTKDIIHKLQESYAQDKDYYGEDLQSHNLELLLDAIDDMSIRKLDLYPSIVKIHPIHI